MTAEDSQFLLLGNRQRPYAYNKAIEKPVLGGDSGSGSLQDEAGGTVSNGD